MRLRKLAPKAILAACLCSCVHAGYSSNASLAASFAAAPPLARDGMLCVVVVCAHVRVGRRGRRYRLACVPVRWSYLRPVVGTVAAGTRALRLLLHTRTYYIIPLPLSPTYLEHHTECPTGAAVPPARRGAAVQTLPPPGPLPLSAKAAWTATTLTAAAALAGR